MNDSKPVFVIRGVKWPLPTEIPLSDADYEVLDHRFVGWMTQLLSDTEEFLRRELSRRHLSEPQVNAVLDLMRNAFLPDWFRFIERADGLIQLFSDGRKRDKSLLDEFFRNAFRSITK